MSEPTTEAGRMLLALNDFETASLDDDAMLRYILAIEAEARASQPLTLDVALLAEALFEARIGVPKDTPYLAGLLLPVIQRLQAEEALERESAT